MNATADTPAFNPCILIPVYNHTAVLENTIRLLGARSLRIVLVDDGSDTQHRAILQRLAADHAHVYLVTRARNGGKGAAVKTGLIEAQRLQFSHALQVDADGQHDLGDVERFLEAARANPAALVAGHPVYDDSVPRFRFYARYLSHGLVWLNTLSFTIIDSMCGFRVYPLRQSCALLKRTHMGNRMDFDGEFIVRWYWAGHPLVQLPTRVVYPADGTSHFRYVRDNVLITIMHTKLFLLMILHIPLLLARKFRAPSPSSRA
jgi:glycosyltransferase involved in cell wall biosynthesis